MADKEVDDLTVASAFALVDMFHIVQGGNSREGNMQKIKDLIAPDTVVSRKTANYTLVNADLNGSMVIEMNLAGANTLTVAPSLTGTEPVIIVQYGAGQTTIVAGAGVTLRSSGDSLVLNDQYSFCMIIKVSGTEYHVVGDLQGNSASTTLVDLTDTPSSYTGEGGKFLRVNDAATAVEFVDEPSGGGTILATYWRITSLICASATGFAIAEIIYRDAPAGTPFTPTTVSAVSVFSPHVASRATDANNTTFWSSSGKNNNEHFQAQFSTAINIGEIEIRSRNDASFDQAPQRFTVEYSNDGTNWKSAGQTIEAVTAYTTGSIKTFNLTTITITKSTTFLGMTDTPSTYIGQARRTVVVNSGETALEFIARSVGVYDKATFTPIATPSAWTTVGVEDPRTAPSVTVTESDTFGYLGWSETGDTLGDTRLLLASAGNPTAGADFDKVFRIDIYQGRNHPCFAGVFARNSANGRLMVFGLFQTNLRWYRQYWNGSTFVSETDVSQEYREVSTFTGYIRLRRIGTDLLMFSSTNGISWVLHDTVTVSTQLVNVDGVGLFTNPDTGARLSVLLWGLDDGPQNPPARV